MRAILIPPYFKAGAETVIIGESDPTRDDVRPCEYLVTDSIVYGPPARAFTALIELDDDDRSAIADGAFLTLTLDGGEVPWALGVFSVESDDIIPT